MRNRAWDGKYRNTIEAVGGGILVNTELSVHRQIETLHLSSGLLTRPQLIGGGMISPVMGCASGNFGTFNSQGATKPPSPPPAQGFQN
tara:strand:- start:43 stop:306 length:264 start_codon:yes stop_codon:yes gene_type:complete